MSIKHCSTHHYKVAGGGREMPGEKFISQSNEMGYNELPHAA